MPVTSLNPAEEIEEAPLVVPDGNAKRAQIARSDQQRIEDLEAALAEVRAELARTKPKAPHGRLRDGKPVPSVSHPYESPREYTHTLVLSTGELVGHSGLQSTAHWSRVLRQNVPVVRVITNDEPESED